MQHVSFKAILTAAAANLAIAAAKFAAALVTGSASLFAESVHSLVDTGNQILLLVGLSKASKPTNEQHPFGYGRELYFYAFVVALLIFLGGGAFAIYEGWHKVMDPEPIRDAVIGGLRVPGIMVNLAVLGFAIVAESYSCYTALVAFRTERGSAPSLAAIRRSKDPATFTVLIEDFAALAGLLIALAGVLFAYLFESPALDGWASIAIGLVLIFVAGFLMNETHGLLIGEAADPALVAAFREAVAAEPGILHLNEVLTQHLGPNDILVNLSADFDDGISAGNVESIVRSLEQRMRQTFPQVGRVFIKPEPRRPPVAPAAP